MLLLQIIWVIHNFLVDIKKIHDTFDTKDSSGTSKVLFRVARVNEKQAFKGNFVVKLSSRKINFSSCN